MGTWGTGAFDNDKAMDWLDDLFESGLRDSVLAVIEETVLEVNYQRVRAAANLVLLTSGAYSWDKAVYDKIVTQLEACKAIELNDTEDIDALSREIEVARHRSQGTKAEAEEAHWLLFGEAGQGE